MKRIILIIGLNLIALSTFHSMEALAVQDNTDVKAHAVTSTNIHFITQYMDGVSIHHINKMHIISIDDYVKQHPGWSVIKQSDTDLFLKKTVDDLSPVSKAVGVLGLKDGNTLTLFKGDPKENEIIQTFFQIDIEALQVNDFENLKKGIRIENKERYQNMLQMLARFEVVQE